MTLWTVITANLTVLIFASLLGVACAWFWSRLLDRAGGVDFKNDVLPKVRSEPLSAAIYYGARWLGVCLLCAMLWSRTV